MQRRTVSIVCIGVVAVLALAAYCGVYEANRLAECASVSSDLGHLGGELLRYRDTRGAWPRTLSQLSGGEQTPTDYVSRLPYAYFPDAKAGTEAVLLSQPKAFRTKVWPFGRMVQMAVLADGRLRDLAAPREND